MKFLQVPGNIKKFSKDLKKKLGNSNLDIKIWNSLEEKTRNKYFEDELIYLKCSCAGFLLHIFGNENLIWNAIEERGRSSQVVWGAAIERENKWKHKDPRCVPQPRQSLRKNATEELIKYEIVILNIFLLVDLYPLRYWGFSGTVAG